MREGHTGLGIAIKRRQARGLALVFDHDALEVLRRIGLLKGGEREDHNEKPHADHVGARAGEMNMLGRGGAKLGRLERPKPASAAGLLTAQPVRQTADERDPRDERRVGANG